MKNFYLSILLIGLLAGCNNSSPKNENNSENSWSFNWSEKSETYTVDETYLEELLRTIKDTSRLADGTVDKAIQLPALNNQIRELAEKAGLHLVSNDSNIYWFTVKGTAEKTVSIFVFYDRTKFKVSVSVPSDDIDEDFIETFNSYDTINAAVKGILEQTKQ